MVTCPYCNHELVIDIKKAKPVTVEGFGKIFKPPKNKMHTGSISHPRIKNIITNYSEIEWDEDSIKITVMGFGDKPAFTMEGTYRKKDALLPFIPVMYHTATPGGGAARLYFWVKEKKYVITHAPLKKARHIIFILLNRYHEILKKENKRANRTNCANHVY